MSKLKPLMKKLTAVNWFPEHFKMGRFFKGLECSSIWCNIRVAVIGEVPVSSFGNVSAAKDCTRKYLLNWKKSLVELKNKRFT